MSERNDAAFTAEELQSAVKNGTPFLRLSTGDKAEIDCDQNGHFGVRFLNPDGSEGKDQRYYSAERIATLIDRWHQYRDPEGPIMRERRADAARRDLAALHLKLRSAFLAAAL